MGIKDIILRLKRAMISEGIDPQKDLGTDLFVFSSTLMPVVNVDLLVANRQGQFLLAWRDDPHCGTGWHIPGGCIRFKETAEERIKKTAEAELGAEVEYAKEPCAVFEIISNELRPGLEDQSERAHAITLVYVCKVPERYEINNNNKAPGDVGYLKWFDKLPDDLVQVQNCYKERWSELYSILRRYIDGNLEKRG